jgi:hypothetical protein
MDSPPTPTTSGVVVLLMATTSGPGLQNAKNALKRFKYHHQVLGLGEKWQGWRHRMEHYRNAAAELPPNTLVVCMDAYDALPVKPSKTLKKTFESFGKPLVFGLETVCGGNCFNIKPWWYSQYGHQYLDANGKRPPNRYVNGGLVMGEAWAIRDLFDWMLKTGAQDDQVGLGRFALQYPDSWAPDVQGLLFQNKVYRTRLLLSNMPHFAHFPGMIYSGTRGYNEATAQVLGHEAIVIPDRRWFIPAVAVLGCLLGLLVLWFLWFLARSLNRFRNPSAVVEEGSIGVSDGVIEVDGQTELDTLDPTF